MSRYQKFIDSRSTPIGYFEIHHIIPRCLGGSDDEDNLIKLTAREHFIAHWMLWKMYPGVGSLAQAFMMMQVGGTTHQRCLIKSSRVYENLKKEAALYNSERGKKRRWFNDGVDQYHIEPEYADKSWFPGRLRGTLSPFRIDVYGDNNCFIETVNNTRELFALLQRNNYKTPRGHIKEICDGAKSGKGSRYGDVWLCHAGEIPVYRTWNYAIGLAKAREKNLGKPNPQLKRMTQERKEKNGIYYITPIGKMKYSDALEYYSPDILREWCKNNPDAVITRLMISKSKVFNHDEHGHWIGKKRSEVGFGYVRPSE